MREVLRGKNSLEYYKDELTTTYNANCLEVMKSIPEESIDLGLTDPPYGILPNGKKGVLLIWVA